MKSRSYVLSAAARLDLIQLWNYLAENTSADVADRVLSDIEAGMKKLVRMPQLGHPRPDLTERELLFYRVHSWLIIYRPRSKPLSVARVLHAARDIGSVLSRESGP